MKKKDKNKHIDEIAKTNQLSKNMQKNYIFVLHQ